MIGLPETWWLNIGVQKSQILHKFLKMQRRRLIKIGKSCLNICCKTS